MRSDLETNFILISGLCLLSLGLIFICSHICWAFLTFPDRAIKMGDLDQQDLLDFPIGLYKTIRGFYVLALFGATLWLLVTLVGEISGWM